MRKGNVLHINGESTAKNGKPVRAAFNQKKKEKTVDFYALDYDWSLQFQACRKLQPPVHFKATDYIAATLTFLKPLAGVTALSYWLPLHKQFPGNKVCSDNVPIFQAHGDFEPVVPYKFGQLSASFLKAYMTNVTFKTYARLSHSSSDDELADMKTLVEQYVAAQ